MGTISGNPTKLEISAREGMGSLDANAIKNKINDLIKGQTSNYISEIEIFLPDGTSVKGIRGATGLFEWV